MKVKQLIAILKQFDRELEVLVVSRRDDEEHLINGVLKVTKIGGGNPTKHNVYLMFDYPADEN